VKSLRSDRLGNLWILLPNTKLLRYHDGLFEAVRGEAENGVTAIGNDPRGAILISSLAMGTFSYNGSDFFSISSSNLSVGTQTANALGFFTPAWSTGLKAHQLAGPASGTISIEANADGIVWLGTEDGGLLCLRQGRFYSMANVAGASISSILPIENSQLWIGT